MSIATWLGFKDTGPAVEAVPPVAEHTPPARPQPEPEPPRPEPIHEDPRNAAAEPPEAEKKPARPARAPLVDFDADPTWTDRLLWVIPAIMTVASAIFTLWSVWDLATGTSTDPLVHAAGLAAGVVVEGGWVWMLIMAHRQAATGHVSWWNTVVGWGLAGATSVILAAHGLQTGNWGIGLLAVLPLIAKAAWHGLTNTRAEEAHVRATAAEDARAAEKAERQDEQERARLAEKEAARAAEADDSSLTVEQRQILAQLENEAVFTEEQAKRQRRLDDAKAKAAHETKIAGIERTARENMARMDATANLMVRKAELEERIELASPPSRRMIALGSGAYAPDDASALGDDGPGFAGVMNRARAASAPTARTGPAGQMSTPAHLPPRGGAQTSAAEAEINYARVWEARDRLIEKTGQEPSLNALARETGLARPTVKRHLEKG